MIRGSRASLLALLVGGAIALSACGPASESPAAPAQPTATLPVPMASLSPQLEGAAGTIQRRLDASGMRLEHVVQPFRTGEPAGLRLVPRALFRVILADPDSGWLVLYELGSRERAAQAATEFVAYLRSGFGQTNFASDAQFSVNQLDGTLMFTWWSRERSGDPEGAEAAFEELRLVGQPYPVVR